MAMTKVEAAKLTNDLLVRGVIETIVQESSILTVLPFEDVTGTAITYNREAGAPSVDWYDVGDTWNESTPSFTQVTAALKILGGDADIDNFLQGTYRNPNDLEAEVIALKAKAVAYEFSQTFYDGDTAIEARQFDGLAKIVDVGQTIAMGTNGAALTLDKMDELIDMVKPGRPDALCMAKRTRRKLSALRRSSGNLLETDVDAFGRRALYYDGIPILVVLVIHVPNSIVRLEVDPPLVCRLSQLGFSTSRTVEVCMGLLLCPAIILSEPSSLLSSIDTPVVDTTRSRLASWE